MKLRKILIIGILCSARFLQAQPVENLFIITLDGLRWQELYQGADPLLITDEAYVEKPEKLKEKFWSEDPLERRKLLMPFFWGTLVSKGQLYGNRNYGNRVNCSNQKWFSYPGYSELLCGYADDARIDSNDKVPNPNTTVLEFFNRQPAYSGKVAAFCSWDVFPYILNEKRSGIPVNAGFDTVAGRDLSERERLLNALQNEIRGPWEGVRLDPFTHHYALEYLKKYEPKIVYIAYGETDDFAHDGRYDQYLEAAHQTDRYIHDLWQYVQSHERYRGKTAFLITTDHGRGTVPKETWRHHGSDVVGSGEIWFAVMGPGTPAWGEMKSSAQYDQGQMAATAAYLLGLDYGYDNERVKPFVPEAIGAVKR